MDKKAMEANAPKGIALTDAEAAAARKEGAKEAEKETGEAMYRMLTDGQSPGMPGVNPYPNMEQVQRQSFYLEMGVEEFEKHVADTALAEDTVAGLLALERAGQNRTPYVKALCKRLKVKSPYEVTSAGPDYTNDVTPTTKL